MIQSSKEHEIEEKDHDSEDNPSSIRNIKIQDASTGMREFKPDSNYNDT